MSGFQPPTPHLSWQVSSFIVFTGCCLIMSVCGTVTTVHISLLCLQLVSLLVSFHCVRQWSLSTKMLLRNKHFWLSGEMGQCDTSVERQSTTLPEHLPCMHWWGLLCCCVQTVFDVDGAGGDGCGMHVWFHLHLKHSNLHCGSSCCRWAVIESFPGSFRVFKYPRKSFLWCCRFI